MGLVEGDKDVGFVVGGPEGRLVGLVERGLPLGKELGKEGCTLGYNVGQEDGKILGVVDEGLLEGE